MFFVPVLCAGVGALLASRGKPETRCEKKHLLGPVSGVTYEVEDFKEAGFVVVKAPDGSKGVFQRLTPQKQGDPRFAWRQGMGQAPVLHLMCQDLGIVAQKPAQPKPTSS